MTQRLQRAVHPRARRSIAGMAGSFMPSCAAMSSSSHSLATIRRAIWMRCAVLRFGGRRRWEERSPALRERFLGDAGDDPKRLPKAAVGGAARQTGSDCRKTRWCPARRYNATASAGHLGLCFTDHLLRHASTPLAVFAQAAC